MTRQHLNWLDIIVDYINSIMENHKILWYNKKYMIDKEELKNIVREVKNSVRQNNKNPLSLGNEIKNALSEVISSHPDKDGNGSAEVEEAFRMYFAGPK